MKLLLILVGVFSLSNAWLFSKPQEWNALKVKWGVNPLDSSVFKSMPTTEADAKSQGWTSNKASCEGSILGRRYVKNGDAAVQLLFDKNGYIAGISAGIPQDLSNHYPAAAIKNWFRSDNGLLNTVAYFTDPATICTSGRTAANFEKYGVGDAFYLQVGDNPTSDLIKVPMGEGDVDSSMWTKGKCFYTMGNHYWYNLSYDMNCDEFRPIFLLYNKKKLDGFGWAFRAPLQSNHYEHPTGSVTNMFMNPPPKCVHDSKEPLSTMHIYMTNSPRTSFC